MTQYQLDIKDLISTQKTLYNSKKCVQYVKYNPYLSKGDIFLFRNAQISVVEHETILISLTQWYLALATLVGGVAVPARFGFVFYFLTVATGFVLSLRNWDQRVHVFPKTIQPLSQMPHGRYGVFALRFYQIQGQLISSGDIRLVWGRVREI